MTAETMKAHVYATARGGLETNLRIVDLPIPEVPTSASRSSPCVLVAITHVSLNPADYKNPEGPIVGPLIIRKPATPCLDFAGRIVKLPPLTERNSAQLARIKDFKPGDLVFGRLDWPYKLGALAQYILAQPDGLARLPQGVSGAQGAALGTAAITAYQSLQPYIKPGDRVFVNGGSGGVGTFTIQMAKLLGASHVTATCSAANAALCKELGADEVIDYRSQNIEETLKVRAKERGEMYDVMVENVEVLNRLFEEADSYLNPGGTFMQVAGTVNSFRGIWKMACRMLQPVWLGGVNRRWRVMLAQNNPAALDKIAEWAGSGSLKIIIDSEYEFEDAKQAFVRLKTGRSRGKVVVKVAQ